MMSESKVSSIMVALRDLENDMDSLNSTVADMKRQMTIQVQKETDELYEKTREMANKQAEKIIEEARAKAKDQAAKITQEAETRLSTISTKIDAGFEDAVYIVLESILKPGQ